MTTVEKVPDGSNTEPPPATADTEDHHGQKLLRLGLIVTALVVLSIVTGTFAIAAFVMAVILIVMVHEFGHFVTAKRAGMKVTEYFLGFGPKLWSIRKGETEYGVKALPLGGYVKIIGMSNMESDVDPADEPRTYRQKSFQARVTVALAGIFTHFVLAFVLLMLIWSVLGVPNLDKASIRAVSPDAPAAKAGLRPGDQVISVDGRTGWSDIRTYLRERPGQTLDFVIKRDGRDIALRATPAETNPDGEPVGFLGVETRPIEETVNPLVGAVRSGEQLAELSVLSVKGLAAFFSPSSLSSYANLLMGDSPEAQADGGRVGLSDNEKRPVSLVGVGRLAGQAAETGAREVIILLVLLNVFIAIFNLVPLLPLDGGHVAIAAYERIRSRKGRRYHADVRKMMPVTAAVLAVLLLLGVTSIYLDIANPIPNPFQ